jgi:peroxiredoxin
MKRAATLLIAALAPLAMAEGPRQSPEFTIHLPQGGQMLLSSQRGKVVCLEFLFTTCPHCQHASQLMNKLYAEYGPRGFQPIGVAFNEMSQMLVPDFIRDFQVKFPVGYASREAVQTYLGIPPDLALHVPQIVFIDRNGTIRQQSLPRNDSTTATEQNMRTIIEKLLSERATPAAKTAPAKKKAS